MSKIFLKGVNKPVTVTRVVAEAIKLQKLDPAISEKQYIVHGDFMSEKGDIRHIILNDAEDNASESSESRKEVNETVYQESNKSYESFIRRRCAMSIEERSLDTRIATLIYQSYTDVQIPPPDFTSEIINRQRDYFMIHPKHPYASVDFQDLLPRLRDKENPTIADEMPGIILSKMYQIMTEALRTARYLHLL